MLFQSSEICGLIEMLTIKIAIYSIKFNIIYYLKIIEICVQKSHLKVNDFNYQNETAQHVNIKYALKTCAYFN